MSNIFKTIKNHLLTQRVRSFTNENGCSYRGPNGTKCAVGVLINDEFYTTGLEGRAATSDIVRKAVSNSIGDFTSEELRMMRDMQLIHDDVDPEDWELEIALTQLEKFENAEHYPVPNKAKELLLAYSEYEDVDGDVFEAIKKEIKRVNDFLASKGYR